MQSAMCEAVDQWFQSARRDCVRLSAEEERELTLKMRAGDAEARDALIRSVLPWVGALAMRAALRYGLDEEHALSLANENLLHFLERFDPDKGRLVTFLGNYMMHRIARLDRGERFLVRLPEHAWAAGEHVAHAKKMLSLNSSTPDSKGKSEEVADSLFSQSRQAYVDGPLSQSIRSESMQAVRSLLNEAIESLKSERSRFAVRRYFWHDETHAEIGVQLGVTRERVRQILDRSLWHIKTHVGEQTGRLLRLAGEAEMNVDSDMKVRDGLLARRRKGKLRRERRRVERQK